MTFRFSVKTLYGAAGMLGLGAALAVGQDTSKAKPRSDRRIPISKEAPGDVVRPVEVRTDTVTVFRTDTVNTTTRITVTDTSPDHDPRRHGDSDPGSDSVAEWVDAGLGVGYSTPAGALYTPNSAGMTGQFQLGWQNAKQVFGVRFDLNGAWPGQDSRFSNLQGDAKLYNASLDGKVQLPFVNRLFGREHRFSLYGIGGYTYTRYQNVPLRVDSPAGTDVAVFVPGTSDWHGQSGWNAAAARRCSGVARNCSSSRVCLPSIPAMHRWHARSRSSSA